MKKFLVLILISCMCLLTGCGQNNERTEITISKKDYMFVCIQPADLEHPYSIVYQKDTKVMYAVSYGAYNQGNFTLLVNPDGTPMIYEDEKEDE